jgi:hypothetical protein
MKNCAVGITRNEVWPTVPSCFICDNRVAVRTKQGRRLSKSNVLGMFWVGEGSGLMSWVKAVSQTIVGMLQTVDITYAIMSVKRSLSCKVSRPSG